MNGVRVRETNSVDTNIEAHESSSFIAGHSRYHKTSHCR
jgi:hypothetical protein